MAGMTNEELKAKCAFIAGNLTDDPADDYLERMIRALIYEAYEEAAKAVSALVITGVHSAGTVWPDSPTPWEMAGTSVQEQAVKAIRALKDSLTNAKTQNPSQT